MAVTATGGPIRVPVGEGTLGRMFNVLGDTIDDKGPADCKEKWPIHRDPRRALPSRAPRWRFLETGIKVIDLLAPLRQGRQDWPVRRRRRGQDRAYPGAYPQHRHRARRLFHLYRRGRAHPARGNDLWREMTESGVIEKTALVFGQDERAPRGPYAGGPHRPDHGRVLPGPRAPERAAVYRQHLPLRPGPARKSPR